MRRVIALLLVLSLAFAWTPEFSVYVAKKALLDSYPLCVDEIREGALLPYDDPVNADFGEPENLHCDLNCPAYDPDYCNLQSRSCKSQVVAGQIKENAEHLCDCDQARELARAITYFIAKDDPLNRMVHENCSEFDSQVEEMVFSGSSDWTVEVTCQAPNKTFTYTYENFEDLVSGARSFAFANAFSGTQQWYCYTLSGSAHSDEGDAPIIKYKSNGELCNSDDECESNNCVNHVCCESGRVCCPSPGVKGYPCQPGEVCTENYYCVGVSLENGQPCESDYECISGNCRPGSKSLSRFYCCEPGYSFCCVSDSDCLSNERCENNACVPREKEIIEHLNTTNDENSENQQSSNCLPFYILTGLAVMGYYVKGKN